MGHIVRYAQGTSPRLIDTLWFRVSTSLTHRTIINQNTQHRDENILRLYRTMSDVHRLVQEAPSLDLPSSQRNILESMAREIIECASFIHEYENNRSFSMPSFPSISHHHHFPCRATKESSEQPDNAVRGEVQGIAIAVPGAICRTDSITHVRAYSRRW